MIQKQDCLLVSALMDFVLNKLYCINSTNVFEAKPAEPQFCLKPPAALNWNKKKTEACFET